MFADEVPEGDVRIKYAVYPNADASIDSGALAVIGINNIISPNPVSPDDASYLGGAYLGAMFLGS
jgi:hypothetical protein